MRFVAVNSVEQQAVLMLHKRRGLMVGQRAMLIHALRSRSVEYGIVTGLGVTSVGRHSGWQAMIQDDPRRGRCCKRARPKGYGDRYFSGLPAANSRPEPRPDLTRSDAEMAALRPTGRSARMAHPDNAWAKQRARQSHM